MKWVIILIVSFFIGFNMQVGSRVHEISSIVSLEGFITALMAITNFIIGGLVIALLLKNGNRKGD